MFETSIPLFQYYSRSLLSVQFRTVSGISEKRVPSFHHSGFDPLPYAPCLPRLPRRCEASYWGEIFTPWNACPVESAGYSTWAKVIPPGRLRRSFHWGSMPLASCILNPGSLLYSNIPSFQYSVLTYWILDSEFCILFSTR